MLEGQSFFFSFIFPPSRFPEASLHHSLHQEADGATRTDNMTAIIVPLLGWSKLGGVDTSESLREFRLRQNEGLSGRSKRM